MAKTNLARVRSLRCYYRYSGWCAAKVPPGGAASEAGKLVACRFLQPAKPKFCGQRKILAPHRTAPHRTAPHPPHRTAPNAPHRTAPHRTAPRACSQCMLITAWQASLPLALLTDGLLQLHDQALLVEAVHVCGRARRRIDYKRTCAYFILVAPAEGRLCRARTTLCTTHFQLRQDARTDTSG